MQGHRCNLHLRTRSGALLLGDTEMDYKGCVLVDHVSEYKADCLFRWIGADFNASARYIIVFPTYNICHDVIHMRLRLIICFIHLCIYIYIYIYNCIYISLSPRIYMHVHRVQCINVQREVFLLHGYI